MVSPRASRSPPSASLPSASRLSPARSPSAPARPSPLRPRELFPRRGGARGGQRSEGGASWRDDGLPALSGSPRTPRGLPTRIGTKSTARLLMSLEKLEREVAARLRPLFHSSANQYGSNMGLMTGPYGPRMRAKVEI